MPCIGFARACALAAIVATTTSLGACAASTSAETAAARSTSTSAPAADTPAWRSIDTASRPTARHENAMAALDGRLYLVGGRDRRPLDVFDPASGQWTQAAHPPVEPVHHMQAVAHDGRLWILGALTGDFPAEPAVPVVLSYDPASATWAQGPEVPQARRRGAAALAVHDGVFYLVGGVTRGHNGGFVPWLDAFDPATGTWTALADAPHARDHFQAAVLDGHLYAAGGRTSSHETGEVLELSVAKVDVYDIAAGAWSTLDAPLPTPRSGNTTLAWQGRIVVIGGESSAQQAGHAEVDAWNPATGTWEALPPLPAGRHGTQAAVLDGAIHIVAGSGDRGGGPELDDHWVLDGRAVDGQAVGGQAVDHRAPDDH